MKNGEVVWTNLEEATKGGLPQVNFECFRCDGRTEGFSLCLKCDKPNYEVIGMTVESDRAEILARTEIERATRDLDRWRFRYHRLVWNAAIEAAAQENDKVFEFGIAEDIRKLKID